MRAPADSWRATARVLNRLLRRRTVTVYLDGREALRFRRERGPGGERSVRLVFRAADVPDDVVARVRDDILQRWDWRERNHG